MKTPRAFHRIPSVDRAKKGKPTRSRPKSAADTHSNGHAKSPAATAAPAHHILKCPTGIRGLDELTLGGFPRDRITLICGGAGTGKTLLAVEFIAHGARHHKEPGVYLSFDETPTELANNTASIGADLTELIQRKRLIVDHIMIDRSEITQTGEYNLDGLFIRLDHAIASIGAKRIVLDGIESLFIALPNEKLIRSELRRLFDHLKQTGVTTVITGEQGEKMFTRHGLEEYISDCVVLLDHRVTNLVYTRRLRIVKYRGSFHETNECPVVIDDQGLIVLPISSLSLNYPVSNKRITTGIERLDTMLGGKGFYQGSSILISGSSGTGKTSLAACFAAQTCKRGERCLFLLMEESPQQLIRNMGSIGIDLSTPLKSGLLSLHAVQPKLYGIDRHLLHMQNLIKEFRPSVMISDPITTLAALGSKLEINTMYTRLIDFTKNKGITTYFTNLTDNNDPKGSSVVGISSMIDTWIMLAMVQTPAERNRLIYVLKSRGMAHSNQIREFKLIDRGIDVLDVYTGSGEIYTGTGQLNRQAVERANELARRQAAERHERELNLEHRSLEAQIGMLKARAAGIETEKSQARDQVRLLTETAHTDAVRMATARTAD